MDLDDIKRGLRAEIKKRENEQYATFQCNVRQMCKDVLSKLEEQESAIAELKTALKESEEARYEAGADAADYYQENRRLERALWLTRAERAEECHFMWCQLIYDKKYGIVKFNVRKEWGENVKQGQTLHTPQGWADVWEDVERKCSAKAEEYK